MAQINGSKSLKNIEKCSAPYYIKELVPCVVERRLFQPEEVGRLGKSADQIGMGKIRAKTSAGRYVVEFLNKATIHGLNHICAPHRHFIERILAILFVGMGLLYTVVLSLYSWDHYQNNAAAMVLDYDYKKFEITKPAVTICPYKPVDQSKFPDVFEKFGIEDTQEARDFFLFISRPSYLTLNQTPRYTGSPPEKWMKVLRDLYVDFNNLGTWDNEASGLDELSSVNIITERGLCTTAFGTHNNDSSPDYWSPSSWLDFQETPLPAWTYTHRDDEIQIQGIPGPEGTPICNVTQLHCIGNHAELISSMKINGSDICKCPVDCNEGKYLPLSVIWPVEEKPDAEDFLKLRSLIISVEYPYYIFRYEVFFGFNEFLISVGGAAGLLLGASIVSFIEILYYITLRLFWYRKHISQTRRK